MQTQFYDHLSEKTTSRDFSSVQIISSKHESGHFLITFYHSLNYSEEFLIDHKEWDIIRHNHFSQ